MLKILSLIIILFFSQQANASQIEQFILQRSFDAADIQMNDAENVIHNLTDYKGKVVLLNFWATWCEPCVNEMPALDNLAKYMEGKGVEVIPLSIDFKGVAAVKQFYKEKKINNLPVRIDEKGRAFKEYKLQALPTTLVIDRRGKVIAKILGEIDWGSQEVRDYLLSVGK